MKSTRPQRQAVAMACPFLIVGAIALLAVQGPPLTRAEDKIPVVEFAISGPFQHENLTIFLIHGKDRIKGATILTLQEALEQRKAIVHETGSVNELIVENVSKDVEVFIQSGD